MEFFQNMDILLRTFWFIALPVSLLFVIQSIMTFIGIDSGHDGSADVDTDVVDGEMAFHPFTYRNMINFLLGFSWSGILFFNIVQSKILLIALSVFVGMCFVALFFLIVKQVLKLEENNTFTLSSAIGKTGEVYLAIPGEKSGYGKIQISIKGAFHEINALTLGTKIERGMMVKVVSVEGNELLIVERV